MGGQWHGAQRGARESLEFVKKLDFEPSRVAFDSAFEKKNVTIITKRHESREFSGGRHVGPAPPLAAVPAAAKRGAPLRRRSTTDG